MCQYGPFVLPQARSILSSRKNKENTLHLYAVSHLVILDPNQNCLCLADHKTFGISGPVVVFSVSIPFSQGCRNRFQGTVLRNRLSAYVFVILPSFPWQVSRPSPSSLPPMQIKTCKIAHVGFTPYHFIRHTQICLSPRAVRPDTLSVLQRQFIALVPNASMGSSLAFFFLVLASRRLLLPSFISRNFHVQFCLFQSLTVIFLLSIYHHVTYYYLSTHCILH